MERTLSLRQGIGALFLFGIFTATSLTNVKAATQGKLGNTSTGSFSITLIVYPSLQSQVAIVDESTTDENGNPVIIPTSTLSFDRPVSLCVSGRGLSQFSLASSGADGVDLRVSEPAGETRITGQPSAMFGVENDCRNSSRQLIAQPLTGFQGSKKPATLLIHAE
ncbi:hypothetical protein [Salinisphaera sp. G21_0]|uniref:hypothetical protein n=1 Tax=Salinisphaera sp. G21_0 TaxID=2821094 RepID=UPI001ADA900B|nr:hypothetical protein [Salinisphaera sp. G21_0]MBO9482116.1 hypothetical protein [Salinisphaera sp. G21_0]MBO9494654.1 hypothetical protein [Thalassotalea sp. G20_0]